MIHDRAEIPSKARVNTDLKVIAPDESEATWHRETVQSLGKTETFAFAFLSG